MAIRTQHRKSPAIRRADRTVTQSSLDGLLDPIITMNAGGFIQSASDSIEQMFGWTPLELFGRNVKVLIPEPRRSALDRYLDRYRHSDRPNTLERTRRFEAIRKDGKLLQIELSMSRADLPSHGTPYFIGIIRDVSTQIDVGEDPASSRSRLQQLVTAQTRALATANLRLQLADRLASLGTLAAGLGHDMNNVLLPVRARLNALEHAKIPVGAMVHVKAVRRSIAYLQHLTDGLHFLALDPDGPGSPSDNDATTDVERWWGHVGSLLRKAVPRHVTVRTKFAKGLPMVRVAPHWLTQAILNLIVNAGESIPAGRRNGRVRVWTSLSEDQGMVRIGVTDNGSGMTAVVQKRAFDLFFTTKPRGMGTGLGLPLARKVAIRAGGELHIKSRPKHGTTVTLSLPTVASENVASTPGEPATRWATIAVREHRTSALIAQIIASGGFRVRTRKDGSPGRSDLWVTDPTPKALLDASRWKRSRAARSLVVLGKPPKRAQSGWAALGATIIDPPDDFEAMRHALGVAIGPTTLPTSAQGKS